MSNLIPRFILDKHTAGETNGRLANGHLQAVCLFADISGFSTVTNTLVAHGSEAAELMADIMLAIFEPLVDAVAHILHGLRRALRLQRRDRVVR